MRRVYAHYRTSADPGVSKDSPGGTAFLTRALLDAFAKDSELSHDETGVIDPEPICDCQFYGPLRVESVTMTEAAAGTVKAQVNFDNFGHHDVVVLTLSRTKAGWRTADIANRHCKSVMAALQASNAHLTGPGAPNQH